MGILVRQVANGFMKTTYRLYVTGDAVQAIPCIIVPKTRLPLFRIPTRCS
jgi:hypothetical protein